MIILASFFIIVVVIAPYLLCYLYEKWVWNGGVCRKTGMPWRLDKSSGRPLFFVDGCGNSAEIWYRSIVRRR